MRVRAPPRCYFPLTPQRRHSACGPRCRRGLLMRTLSAAWRSLAVVALVALALARTATGAASPYQSQGSVAIDGVNGGGSQVSQFDHGAVGCSAAWAAAVLRADVERSGAAEQWAQAAPRIARGTLRLIQRRRGAQDAARGARAPTDIAGEAAEEGANEAVFAIAAPGSTSGGLPRTERVVLTPDARTPPWLREPGFWRVEAVERTGNSAGRYAHIALSGEGTSARPGNSSALVVIAGGDECARYIARHFILLVNKALRARRHGEHFFVWTGGVPPPLSSPGAECMKRGPERLTDGVGGFVGCDTANRSKSAPSACPKNSTAPGAPSVHYAKMQGALLALDEPGVSDVAVVDMDAVFSHFGIGPAPRFDSFYDVVGSPGASAAFMMGHWAGVQHAWAPLGDAFHVRKTPTGRDFLLAWLGARCGLKDQPPLWDLLLRMYSAAGLLSGPYPAPAPTGSGSVSIFDIAYEHRFGPDSFSRSYGPLGDLKVDKHGRCAGALKDIPVAYFGGATVAGWQAANDFDKCALKAAKRARRGEPVFWSKGARGGGRPAVSTVGGRAGRDARITGTAGAEAPVHGTCILWHLGSNKLANQGTHKLFGSRWR